jgi:MFS family permease
MLPAKRDLAALSIRCFRRFALARAVSMLGNAFGPIALSFGLLQVFHGDPFPLSVVLAAQALPQLAFVLVGGVLADRFSQKRVVVAAELLAAASWGTLGALVVLRDQSVWTMAVVAAVGGTATALVNPALTGLAPRLVPDDQLQSANALLRLGNNIARIVGLGLAGAAVATAGPAAALVFDAATYLFAAVVVATLRIPRVTRAKTTARRDLAAGWREFRTRQWLWASVGQFAIVVAATNAYAGVLGPLLAQRELGGPGAWSLLLLCQALGALAGVVVALRVRPRRPVLVAASLTPILALPMALLALGAPLALVALAGFAAGVSSNVYGVLWETTIQREVSPEAISRVSAFDFLGSTALAPVGLFVAAPIAGILGAQAATMLFAAAVVAATIGALCAPGIRSLTARPEASVGRAVAAGAAA